MEIQFILYVADQEKSKDFYKKFLRSEPSLNVPGMTEFVLGPGVKLGLMPETGIKKILKDKMPDPRKGNGIPRCELYLRVPLIDSYVERARKAGAEIVSPAEDRDWGDHVCYLSDPDGHVIAIAQSIETTGKS